ncbi:MAG: hypothetical protein PVH26_15495, partial [Desulfosarcina sp.]
STPRLPGWLRPSAIEKQMPRSWHTSDIVLMYTIMPEIEKGRYAFYLSAELVNTKLSQQTRLHIQAHPTKAN